MYDISKENSCFGPIWLTKGCKMAILHEKGHFRISASLRYDKPSGRFVIAK